MMKSQQKGYTLMELMVVVAIIAILAAFTVPIYIDYIKKTKVAEASMLFDDFKTRVLMLYTVKGTYPTFSELITDGVTYQGTFVLGSYDDKLATAGTPQVCFEVTGVGNIGWKYIPDPTKDLIPTMFWSCKASDSGCTIMEDKYLPWNCRDDLPMTL